ncbi:hypothetical protein ACI799_06540 [Blastococcus sp. SYSU DS0753]
MTDVKLAAIYYSATGTIHAMARRVAEAGEKAGAEAPGPFPLWCRS